ncbi:alpha-hydroxy acid oxidase [Parapedobacter soli]|uniref:alpha-hydroxy acid oxidase n=1 Tax=Parapedobacter soli TaxID=416955 RepID=UPI0021CA4085|nr:alpha-hydroxy acid oxidase [Parapedobacter soli]
MKNISSKILSVEDARYFAKKRVPAGIYQMFEAGSGSNVTAEDNVKAFEAVRFRPRNAVFHPEYDISTTVLGHKISMPAIVSSVGFLATGHIDGEAGVARAAGKAGTIQFVSGVTGTPIEKIMEAATGPVFYQLYYIGGRDASAPIIERVKKAGVSGLILTVDTPTIARPRDLPYTMRRSVPYTVNFKEAIKFIPQIWNKPAWTWDFIKAGLPEPEVSMGLRPDGTAMSLFEGIAEIYKETPKWEDIPWVRKHWDGPLIIKGILTAADAKRAVEMGADAIVVSNHGGNVLDGSVSTLPVLTEIVEAVGDKIEVLVDSGVRRGTDVLKAVALGAKAVLLGRAYLYPLLAAGEQGVSHILDLFHQQIYEGLAFLGAQSIDDLDPSYVELPAHWRQPKESRVLEAVS